MPMPMLMKWEPENTLSCCHQQFISSNCAIVIGARLSVSLPQTHTAVVCNLPCDTSDQRENAYPNN